MSEVVHPIFTIMTDREGTALAGTLLIAAFLVALVLPFSGYLGMSLSDDARLIVAPVVSHEAHCMKITLYYMGGTAETIRIPTAGPCAQIEIERFRWRFVDGRIARIDKVREAA